MKPTFLGLLDAFWELLLEVFDDNFMVPQQHPAPSTNLLEMLADAIGMGPAERVSAKFVIIFLSHAG